MEIIIISAFVTIFTEVVKRVQLITGNREMTKAVIILITVLAALLAAIIYKDLSPETLATWAKIWLIAIGLYETLYKRIIEPAFKKIK